jgi:hypothetical protein
MPAWSRPAELFESVWAYDLANGTIAVGWGELGDIRGMDTKTFTALCRQAFPQASETTYRNIWRTLSRFHGTAQDGVAVGDSIVACRGRSAVVGIGTVTGPSFYDEVVGAERMRDWTHLLKANHQLSYPHFLPVSWHIRAPTSLPGSLVLPRSTFSEMSNDRFKQIARAAR